MGRASRQKRPGAKAGARAEQGRRSARALAVALLLALGGAGVGILLARGSEPPDRTGVSLPGGGTVATPPAGPIPGIEQNFVDPPERAPGFTLTTLDGETFSLGAQRGRPVVLFFMAGWCATCIPEAQALGRIHEELGDRVRILAVSIDPTDTPEQIRGFIEAAGNPAYPFAHDQTGRMARAYDVLALDTTVIIDGRGRIVYRDSYVSPEEHLRAGLDVALS
ncbi:MAG: peroxiredoxin family protein [Actinomycetota bacterium]